MKNLFCAHRGVSALMPENTLPAFASALALGADEIEFDVRLTKDNKMIVSHDDNLERISDGKGKLCESTLDELLTLNIGVHNGWVIPFNTAEEVFGQLANKLVFNIHVKESGEDGYLIRELTKLIEKYDAVNSCYFAAVPDELEWMVKVAPHISRTAIQHPGAPDAIGMARTYKCDRVQLWRGMFTQGDVDTLLSEGVSCNIFWGDSAADYTEYFDMGINCILTNRMDLAAQFKRTNPKYFA